MIDNEFEDVKKFHRKLGLWPDEDVPGFLTNRKMNERIKFLQEELDEIKKAADQNDIDGIIDGLIDLDYVAKGTGAMMGINWTAHWAEVQRANMSKERGVGPRGNVADAIKPPGWQGPDHRSILEECGYQEHLWVDRAGNLVRGRDDPEHLPKESGR